MSLFTKVFIFGYAYDGHTCRSFAHLNVLGIPYTFFDLRSDSCKKHDLYNPNLKNPQYYFGEECLVGFEELRKRFPL